MMLLASPSAVVSLAISLLTRSPFQRLLTVTALLPDSGNGPSQHRWSGKKSRFNLMISWHDMPKEIDIEIVSEGRGE